MGGRSFLFCMLVPCLLWSQHDHAAGKTGKEEGAAAPELNGSGTSRLPQSTPMHAIHTQAAQWNIMTHGAAYLRYTHQNINNPDQRGENDFDAPNWLMVMGGRDFSGGMHRLDLRTMLSLDALTEGGNGYPLLFATGETWRNEPLVDRQHPHDLFMELAAILSHRLTHESQVFLYLGLPGEPALGPTAYMHRPANQTNPDAVLSHHNQDATHITFGVATLGWMNRMFKVDGSVFTGREPDEDRYRFDRPRFDSYSLRLAYDPNPSLAMQLSAGFLKSPEATEPEEDLLRITASAVHLKPYPGGRFLSSGLVYGANSHLEGELDNSFTAESEWDWNLGTVYGRLEAVQKSGADLGIPQPGETRHWVNGATLGSSIRLLRRRRMQAALGAQGTINLPESDLRPYYGDVPLSFEIFLRIGPDIMMGMDPKIESRRKTPVSGGHGGH